MRRERFGARPSEGDDMKPTARAGLAVLVAGVAFLCAVVAAHLGGAGPSRCLAIGLLCYAAGWAWTMLTQSLIAHLSDLPSRQAERRRPAQRRTPDRGQEPRQPGRE
jgi:hypothetical protein